MFYQLRIISFFVIIICSFKSVSPTVIHDIVKSAKDQSHTSERNILEILSLAQNIQELSEHSVILRVYTGSVTKLQCKLNPRQIGKDTVVWYYSPTNLSFNPLEEEETITNKWNLTIYNTRFQHAGMYQCATDRYHDGVVVLEVVDDEKYNVVKPQSSNGPYASKPVVLNSQLMMFSAWSEWSECSRCELAGRKRRYGVCYVALIDKSTSAETKQNASIEEESKKLFHTFPGGIPCRSQILPPHIRNISLIQTNSNEIMIGMCKVKCKESILKIRSKSGNVIETVDNTAGIFSLSQNIPPQPPLPTRTIMYVEPGKRVVIKCFGTTLRDIPFTWRLDTQEISPRDLDGKSNGRVHLNARDHIIFTSVLYSDAHVYSCWQADMLAGVVTLRVQRSAESAYTARLTVFMIVLIATMSLRLTMRLVRYRRRYLGKNVL